MFQTQRVHPFPFRTRKLSSAVPKILAWRRVGKIGHSRHTLGIHFVSLIAYSSIAQSVEHLTVNQGVTGSSPVGGAKKRTEAIASVLFLPFPPLYPNTPTPCAPKARTGQFPEWGTSRVGACANLYVTWFEMLGLILAFLEAIASGLFVLPLNSI